MRDLLGLHRAPERNARDRTVDHLLEGHAEDVGMGAEFVEHVGLNEARQRRTTIARRVTASSLNWPRFAAVSRDGAVGCEGPCCAC
jgi:hypothetical protein